MLHVVPAIAWLHLQRGLTSAHCGRQTRHAPQPGAHHTTNPDSLAQERACRVLQGHMPTLKDTWGRGQPHMQTTEQRSLQGTATLESLHRVSTLVCVTPTRGQWRDTSARKGSELSGARAGGHWGLCRRERTGRRREMQPDVDPRSPPQSETGHLPPTVQIDSVFFIFRLINY